jgi:hypothetical protein
LLALLAELYIEGLLTLRLEVTVLVMLEATTSFFSPWLGLPPWSPPSPPGWSWGSKRMTRKDD